MPVAKPDKTESGHIAERFSTISMRRKLMLLSTSSVLLALVVSFTAIAVNDVSYFRKAKIEQLESETKMLAFNSVGVLTFQDSEATRELLQSMAMYPTVDYASVMDDKGNVLAEYVSSRVKGSDPNPDDIREWLLQAKDSGIEIVKPVLDGGETIGHVRILANLNDFHDRLWSYFNKAGIILLLALGGATLYSRFVQRSISEPINELAQAARTVKDKNDYSIRVRPQSQDEIGELGSTFNQMLEMIESSKAALQRANNELESRVEDRTSQLTREIEQRRTAQEGLEKAIDQAESSNRAKSEFLANMSHEIRTPLTGILGFAEVLSDPKSQVSDEMQLEYLRTISSSGRHLLELINDILDLSKIEAGQLNIEITPCSPNEVTNQVVSVLRARAQEKDLDLTCEWTTKVPETVKTDGGRLRQLLMNLVGNAIKFTHKGSVTILLAYDETQNELTIRVRDTGIGIAANNLQSIFDPFVQADSSVTRKYGGTGLGLAISYRIAKALRGELCVESEEGKGSTFIVRLDAGQMDGVKLLESTPADAIIRKPATDEVENVDLRGVQILLVEDGEINRKLICFLLEELGALVKTAENGLVGVQMAGNYDFDLIIMDMQMPVMDGYTATSRIRKLGYDLPILALTAHAMKGDEEKCIRAGCTRFLSKPVDRNNLIRTVAACVGINLFGDFFDPNLGDNKKPEKDAILSTLPLDQPVFQQIVVEFVEFLSDEFEQMQSAYDEGDFDKLATIAHRVKGAGGTAGFDVLTAPASRLQRCSSEGNVNEIQSTLDEIRELTDRIVATEQVVQPTSK